MADFFYDAIDYDSEREDRPRVVLDVSGDFTIRGATSNDGRPVVLKLHEIMSLGPKMSGSVIACPPVPPPADVAKARQLMGSNVHGVWTATIFEPPRTSTNAPLAPDQVFSQRKINSALPFDLDRFCIRHRFVPSIAGLKTMCIYSDGACLDNGSRTATPRGGCAFVFNKTESGTVSIPLENKGPDGQQYAHTNNRAELRAVLSALTFRYWWGEGWQRVVVITDSEYVATHAIEWLRKWAERGWRTASGRTVANRDLWEELSNVMGIYADGGCEISFWTVPRQFNAVADRAAKAVAKKGGNGVDKYATLSGYLV